MVVTKSRLGSPPSPIIFYRALSQLTITEWAQGERGDKLCSINHINVPQSREPLVNQGFHIVHNGAKETSTGVSGRYGDVKGVRVGGQKLNQEVRLL